MEDDDSEGEKEIDTSNDVFYDGDTDQKSDDAKGLDDKKNGGTLKRESGTEER